MKPPVDVTVAGGGIVGLATGDALLSAIPRLRLLILEKEPAVAMHQSGRNSGVIHSGVYYRPGSLKARLCAQGAAALRVFCEARGIPVRVCGKVIVALSEPEIPHLEELHRRGLANGVAGLSLIGPERLRELEPHAGGIRALHVPGAAAVDFREVAAALAREIQERGGRLLTETRLLRLKTAGQRLLLETSRGAIMETRFLINCGGLHSDRLARGAGVRPSLRIIPFRGEYWELVPERRSLVRGLIYPVPNPRLPFLGIHLSKTADGRVEVGPSAILALHRQGYRRRDVNLRDAGEMLSYPGFWRMILRHWRYGLEEIVHSMSKEAFLRSAQRLVPALRAEDLVEAPSGVRAQAVTAEGNLLDDFHLIAEGRALHVLNAPSPAATAALAIGEHITEAATRQFGL